MNKLVKAQVTQVLKLNWWGLSAVVQEMLLATLSGMALELGYAFAFYSLPEMFYTQKLSMRRSMPRMIFAAEDLQTATIGEWRHAGYQQEIFVFSPFVLKKTMDKQFLDFPFCFLRPSIIWDCEAGTLQIWNHGAEIEAFAKRILVEVKQVHQHSEDAHPSRSPRHRTPRTTFERTERFFYTRPNPAQTTTQQLFTKNVRQGVTHIREGKLQKFVLSRVRRFTLPNKQFLSNHRVVAAFVRALTLEKHRSAMVSLFASPLAGTWLTVSPEILVSQTQGVFRTISLAGTQPCKKSLSPAQLETVTWRDKDIQEQAMVSRYIVNCFKILRLRSYTEVGPETVHRGNLLHLETCFNVDTKRIYGSELVLDMLALLHPTSAVAGDPLNRALRLIQQLEQHKRRYYGGFLGPLYLKGLSAIYVNLRCAEILERDVMTYAGTGIVYKSSPQLEWEESEYKLNVVRELFMKG